MDIALVLILIAVLGVVAILGLVLAIILFAGRRRPQPGLGPRPAAPGAPVEGVWNAEVHAGGILGSAFSDHGRLHVDDGWVRFVLDGHPQWQAPCSQVRAWRIVGGAWVGGGSLGMQGPMGQVAMTVSREHINRFSRNSIKTMREPEYVDEVLRALAAGGAIVQP